MKKLEKVSGFINEAYLADSTIIDAGTFNIERTSFCLRDFAAGLQTLEISN